MTEENARQTLAETTGNETILIVEDEEVIRLMLVEVLTMQGYAVLEAGHAADALAIMEKRREPIDLLVSDLTMPGMNGWELAKRLRAGQNTLPVLFVSGHNDHETSLWGRMDPPAEHLFKPFSLEAFLYKARQMLDREKKTDAPQSTLQTPGNGSPASLS